MQQDFGPRDEILRKVVPQRPAPAAAGNLKVVRDSGGVGLSMVAVLIGGVGGWATTSQLVGAVIAPGTIVVESNVKKVQHPSVGVVGEILVKEGSQIKDGDVVMRLDDTVTRSTLGV
jgi:HlyD family secretion protein